MTSSSSSFVSMMTRLFYLYNVAIIYFELHIAYGLGASIKSAFTFNLPYLQLQIIAVFSIICAMILFATLLFIINVAEYKRTIIATNDALIADLKAQVLQLNLQLADKNDDVDRLKHVITNMINNNKVQ